MAELAYTRAIDLAEDAPSKTRYEASLSATKSSASASVAAAKRFGVGLQTGTPADMYPNRIRQLNIPIWPGSGLALTMHAYENCVQGMKDLDDAMEKIDENGNLHAKAFSLAMANICGAPFLLLHCTLTLGPYLCRPRLPIIVHIVLVLSCG